jgi:hypothetical protein
MNLLQKLMQYSRGNLLAHVLTFLLNEPNNYTIRSLCLSDMWSHAKFLDVRKQAMDQRNLSMTEGKSWKPMWNLLSSEFKKHTLTTRTTEFKYRFINILSLLARSPVVENCHDPKLWNFDAFLNFLESCEYLPPYVPYHENGKFLDVLIVDSSFFLPHITFGLNWSPYVQSTDFFSFLFYCQSSATDTLWVIGYFVPKKVSRNLNPTFYLFCNETVAFYFHHKKNQDRENTKKIADYLMTKSGKCLNVADRVRELF